MAAKALQHGLLNSLTERQRCLVEEYYSLQQMTSFPDETTHKRLCTIWEEAQTDLILCRRLELIDDLCNDYLDDDTDVENNQRAYWAEYLVPQLLVELDQEDRSKPDSHKDENFSVLIECPNGEHQFFEILSKDDPQAMEEFQNEMCDQCKISYSAHKQYLFAGSGI